MDFNMPVGLKLRVDGVAPNRHGALRYAGGLNVIHVALGVYVRRDVSGRPTLTPPADCELSEFHVKSATNLAKTLSFAEDLLPV
jgi:hypothetical protein